MCLLDITAGRVARCQGLLRQRAEVFEPGNAPPRYRDLLFDVLRAFTEIPEHQIHRRPATVSLLPLIHNFHAAPPLATEVPPLPRRPGKGTL
jgi:hypothetical protein